MQHFRKIIKTNPKIKETSVIPNELNKAGISTLGNYLKENDMSGKTVGMRLELNVSFKVDENGGLVINDTKRIEKAWPDLKSALLSGANVAIMYHVEDKAKVNGSAFKDNSLIAEYLKKRIAQEIDSDLVFDRVEELKFVGSEAKEKLAALKQGKINVLLMQNVRLDEQDRKMEKKNDPALVSPLGEVFDAYVDCGTGLMHRNAASNNAIKGIMKSQGKAVIAGDLFVKDTSDLQKLINGFKSNPDKSVAILGGSKISNSYDEKGKVVEEGKIVILQSMLDLGIRNILIGGKMADPFMVAKGESIGAGRANEEDIKLAKEILVTAKEKGINIVLPVDFRTVHVDDMDGDLFKGVKTDFEIIQETTVSDGREKLDIGPETEKLFAKIINESEYRVFNGPMGVFENPKLAEGTLALATVFNEINHGFGILGGGDTNTALKKVMKSDTEHSKMLAGGGAPLTFISRAGNLETINLMRRD